MKFGVSTITLNLQAVQSSDIIDRWLSFGKRSPRISFTPPLAGLLTNIPLHDIGLSTLPMRRSRRPLVCFSVGRESLIASLHRVSCRVASAYLKLGKLRDPRTATSVSPPFHKHVSHRRD